MTIKECIEGLSILAKYDPDGDMDAQHDEIYAGSTDPSLMEAADREDLERLQGLDASEGPESGLPAAGSMTLDELERGMIEKCLRHYEGNLTRVSEALGLSRAALYRRLRKFGVESSRP